MKLPNFKRLFKTDYQKDYQDLVEKLSVTINNGLEVLYDLANKKISIRDNILCTVKDIEIIVDATGKPITTAGMALDVSGKVEGVVVLRVDNLSNVAINLTSAPFVSFTTSDTNVIINNITGLQAGTKYRLRLVAFQS